MKSKKICLIGTFFLLAGLCFSDEPFIEMKDFEGVNFLPSDIELIASTIPVVKINTKDKKDIDSKTEYKKATFTLLDEQGRYSNIKFADSQVKGRGNSTWTWYSKRSYSIKLPLKVEILGMPESKKWILVPNHSDKSLVRNLYFSYLAKNVFPTVWAASFEPVHLFINEKYRGVYNLGESIKVEKNRLNIKSISKKNKDGGFLIEINKRLDEEFNFVTKRNVPISLKEPESPDEYSKIAIQKYIQEAEDVLFGQGSQGANKSILDFFDLDSVVDWYIMNEFAKNVDAAFFSSIYFYLDPKDNLLHMGPIWDFDISSGNVNYNDCDLWEGLYIRDRSVWIKQMYQYPEFVKKLKERWNSKKGELYKTIESKIQGDADILKRAARLNFTRWPILGEYVKPNPTGFESRTTYQSEVDYLKNWLFKRYEYLDSVFNAL